MKTREKVLDMALRLFNENGIDNTSAKNIAAALNISDGNLRYHFRTKEDIIHQLYLRLVAAFDQKLNEYKDKPMQLKDLYDTLVFVFSRLSEYRFLMLDFVAVMRRYPAIQTHYRQLQQVRQQQYSKFISELIEADIFRKDITIAQYQHMAEHLTILSDFWLSSAEILYQGEAGEKMKYYTELVFSLLLPYLSRKGMYEYMLITDAGAMP